MTDKGIDILIVTHKRPQYTARSLSTLLESCDESTRVWMWHNGNDAATMAVVDAFKSHPRVHQYFHSPTNVGLREPTNWLLREAEGWLWGKVDDDCVVPHDWLATLTQAHRDEARFGAIGCWHFHPSDFDPQLSAHKLREFRAGHRLISHPWIGGSGFLAKRSCLTDAGQILPSERGATGLFLRMARAGWANGWYYPLLLQDHMDDPRSPNTLLRSDEDVAQLQPLSAQRTGAATLAAWQQQLAESARQIQRLPSDPRYFAPWRIAVGNHLRRLVSLLPRRRSH